MYKRFEGIWHPFDVLTPGRESILIDGLISGVDLTGLYSINSIDRSREILYIKCWGVRGDIEIPYSYGPIERIAICDTSGNCIFAKKDWDKFPHLVGKKKQSTDNPRKVCAFTGVYLNGPVEIDSEGIGKFSNALRDLKNSHKECTCSGRELFWNGCSCGAV